MNKILHDMKNRLLYNRLFPEPGCKSGFPYGFRGFLPGVTFLFFLLSFGSLSLAQTGQAEFKATYNDWTLYTRDTPKGKVCYILSKPTDMAPKTVNHGQVYFMLASWKSQRTKQQPSALVGYTMKATTTPVLTIGNHRFEMFVSGREAYIESNKVEKKLIQKMKLGSTMSLRTLSARGTRTSYQFSLRGVTRALQKMQASCS